MAQKRVDALNNLNTRNLCVFLAQTALFCRKNIQNKYDDIEEKERMGHEMVIFWYFHPNNFRVLKFALAMVSDQRS